MGIVYKIVFTKRAERDLKKIDPTIRKQIISAIEALANNPRPPSSKQMKGEYKNFWRERSGNYRIIYEIRDEKLVLVVIRAGHRKDIYR